MIRALHGFTSAPSMWAAVGCGGPALLGHGADAQALGTETFADEVARLTALLPAQPVHLVGYSLGGRLALAIALANPERITRLSLIGVNPGIDSASERAQRRAFDATWSTRLREDGIAGFVDVWQALPLWASQSALSQETRLALRAQRLSHNPEQLARAMDALGTGSMPSMWAALPSLSIPVHFIAGALDPKYVALCERMCELVPNGEVHLIPGAGHNPVLENAQRVRDVIHGAL